MPVRTPPQPFLRRRGRRPAAPPAPVIDLELLAAVYEPGEYVELTFNQAVNVADIDPNEFEISDGEFTSSDYRGDFPVTQPGPAIVRMGLVSMGGTAATDVSLTASATTGIVAVNGGEAWGGVSDLELPFSE